MIKNFHKSGNQHRSLYVLVTRHGISQRTRGAEKGRFNLLANALLIYRISINKPFTGANGLTAVFLEQNVPSTDSVRKICRLSLQLNDSLHEPRQVSRDRFVSYDGVRYGVPWRYSGRERTVREVNGWVEI
ncbi:Mu transposase domain-containing protein [Caldibacillus debilis]|uniref:Mu transposase domain-containing protein n=1 Tax=Caldibacillus debilis TaxID=301148 RepID=UPI0035230BD7